VEAHVNQKLDTSKYTDEIVSLAKTRWVFIAGNTPQECERPNEDIPWFTTSDAFKEKLRDFVIALTKALLERGFSVTACPQVDAVGLHAINTAADVIAGQRLPDHIDYRIAGIFPIDRSAKNIGLSENAKKHWVAHIMKFRRSYLADHDWLVLVGGNQGTQDEYEAAKSLKVKTLAIPCFGGTARRVADEDRQDLQNPCAECRLGGPCATECAERIAEYLLCARPE
jgi:hypothetical protein